MLTNEVGRALKQRAGSVGDGFRRWQAPRTNVAACKIAGVRLNKVHSPTFKHLYIFLRSRGAPHSRIHCWSDENRRFCREQSCRHEIVCDAMCHFGDTICRCRCDKDDIGFLSKRYVVNGVFRVIEESYSHFLMSQSTKRCGTHKLSCVLCHKHFYTVSRFLQKAQDLAGLICCNAAGDAEKDGLFVAGSTDAHSLLLGKDDHQTVAIRALGDLVGMLQVAHARRLEGHAADARDIALEFLDS